MAAWIFPECVCIYRLSNEKPIIKLIAACVVVDECSQNGTKTFPFTGMYVYKIFCRASHCIEGVHGL